MLLSHGGNISFEMWSRLLYVIFSNNCVPSYWCEEVTVSLFKKSDSEDSCNYKSIVVLNLLVKLCSGVTNNY